MEGNLPVETSVHERRASSLNICVTHSKIHSLGDAPPQIDGPDSPFALRLAVHASVDGCLPDPIRHTEAFQWVHCSMS